MVRSVLTAKQSTSQCPRDSRWIWYENYKEVMRNGEKIVKETAQT
jgi:hypothetical protein